MARVTTIIPVHNREEFIGRAIESVLGQTYTDVELVVVDDASTDGTREVVERYDDDRVHLRTFETNRGANAARNAGIEYATGEYIAFLDSDDEWKPEKLDRQIALLNGTDTAVSYTGIENRGEDRQLIGASRATLSGNLSEQLLRENVIGTFSSVVVPAGLVDTVGHPDPELPCYQDWEWYLRLSDHATFTPVPDQLTIKHSDATQISDDFQQKHEVAYPVLRERLRSRADSKRMERVALAGLHFQIGYAAVSNGEYSAARQFFMKSIRNNPRMWRSYLYLLLSGRHMGPIRRFKRALVTGEA